MPDPETLTEKRVKELLSGSPTKMTSKMTLVVIGTGMYKREPDGLFHLLDGERDEP